MNLWSNYSLEIPYRLIMINIETLCLLFMTIRRMNSGKMNRCYKCG